MLLLKQFRTIRRYVKNFNMDKFSGTLLVKIRFHGDLTRAKDIRLKFLEISHFNANLGHFSDHDFYFINIVKLQWPRLRIKRSCTNDQKIQDISEANFGNSGFYRNLMSPPFVWTRLIRGKTKSSKFHKNSMRNNIRLITKLYR